MAVRRNSTLGRQVLTPIVTQTATGTRTRGSAFGSNETEARARGTTRVVRARQTRLGDEVVDVAVTSTVE